MIVCEQWKYLRRKGFVQKIMSEGKINCDSMSPLNLNPITSGVSVFAEGS